MSHKYEVIYMLLDVLSQPLMPINKKKIKACVYSLWLILEELLRTTTQLGGTVIRETHHKSDLYTRGTKKIDLTET